MHVRAQMHLGVLSGNSALNNEHRTQPFAKPHAIKIVWKREKAESFVVLPTKKKHTHTSPMIQPFHWINMDFLAHEYFPPGLLFVYRAAFVIDQSRLSISAVAAHSTPPQFQMSLTMRLAAVLATCLTVASHPEAREKRQG